MQIVIFEIMMKRSKYLLINPHKMKNLFFITLGILISFQVQAQNQAKKFGVKSGKIIMKLDGNAKGTKTIYFDDYGDKYYEEEKSVTEINMFGVTDKSETDEVLIMNKNQFWNIDRIKGENYTGTLMGYQMGKDYSQGLTEADQKQLVDNIINSMGGQRLGEEDVLGYQCEKINVMGINMWLYKGITLKTEGNIMGVVTKETATSFDENISIPASKFEAPEGLEFTETNISGGQNQMNMYQGEMEEALEDLHPIEYPYEDFMKVVNGFNPEGYIRTMVMNQDGQYIALYNQGFADMVVLIATSSKNVEENDEEMPFETFSHKGKILKYGEMDSEGLTGKGLLVPFNEYDMHIMLMSMPGKDKQTLLNWLDQLNF